MMRVLHWFPNFSAGGGVANTVASLAEAQASEGAEVLIASLPASSAVYGPIPFCDPAPTVTTWTGRALGRGPMRLHVPHSEAIRVFRGLAPDVVHLHAEFNLDNWWPPRVWSCPLVLTPQGAFHAAVMRRGARRKAAYLAVARLALYGRVSYFHALHPGELRDITSAIPSARVYCVPQGPSPGVTTFLSGDGGQEVPGAERDDLGPVRFLFVGRIDIQVKGLDVLVEAFARATPADDSRRPAILTLVGPDVAGGVQRLRTLARRHGVEHRVDIRERVPQSDVPTLLRESDVYVQLSRNDGAPLSLNDALVLGKPVIVSEQVGTVSDEQIRSLEHVVVVEPTLTDAARAISEAIGNVADLRHYARDAQPRVRAHLSWRGAAKRHLALYSELLSEHWDRP